MNPSMTDQQRKLIEQTADIPGGAGADARDLPTMDTQVVASEPPGTHGGQERATYTPVPAAAEFQPRNFGEYELIQELARGGMGVVYKARHRTLNRVVALKMILSGKSATDIAVQRFYQEARAAATLDHPNIVPIYDIGQEEGHHFFTMAFIEGKTLKAQVAEQGPLPVDQAIAMMVPIVEAVDFAHQHDIIHRDMKPDNVMIDAQGRPRVTDFGLAKLMAEGDPHLTAAGQILGTPAYMAPEQALGGERKVGPEADVYALGGILHFLLTGAPPFTGTTMTEILSKVITEAPARPSLTNAAVPTGVDEICKRCLEKDATKRYASAADLAFALQREIGPSTPGGAAVAQAAPPPVNRAFAISLAAFAVVLLAGGAFFAYQVTRPDPNKGSPVDPNRNTDDVAQLQIKDDVKNDFGLKAVMVGSMRGEGQARKLFDEDPITFQIEVERDAYIAVWSIESDGTITQLFPNAIDTDQLFQAGKPRTIPSPEHAKDYTINATVSEGVDEVRVVASTQKWDPVKGTREGNYMVFKSPDERKNWDSQRRGLVLKSAPKGDQPVASVAEGFLKYQVFPKGK